ncbi:MAG: protein kinase, partial [Gemmatimonadota bacterium]
MDELQDRLQRALADRYRIERELGSGGMGVVFLAADLKLGRSVAIKVLRPEIAQAIGDERFLREIQISAQLSHPHILSLIDSGVADGLLYYVMFYVHRNGVVHRDVKPENILLEEGHALVCDFGIARAVGEAGGEKLTRTGFVVGTPAYMSPEQGTGEVQVDHRADIYALGCVLYEMLIGTPPFGGVTPQVILARKCTEQVPGLRSVRDTIPLHVEQAVLRALSRTPADRFQSAGTFANALTNPTGAVRETRRERWKAGMRRAALPAAAVVAAAAIVGGAARLLPHRGGGGTIRVRSTQVTASPGLEDSPSFSPDGQWLVYAGDNGADRDIYLRSLTGERAINLTEGTPGDDYSPAFSPDGQQIAFRSTRAGGGLFVMGRTGEAVRRVSERGEDPA